MKDEEPAVSFDQVCHAVTHVERRQLLVRLLESEQVAGGGRDQSSMAKSDVSAVRMKHVHVPKLEQYGFVEREETTDEGRPGPNFLQVQPFLSVLENNENKLSTSRSSVLIPHLDCR